MRWKSARNLERVVLFVVLSLDIMVQRFISELSRLIPASLELFANSTVLQALS